MYEGVAETWREWGRSLDLKDASSIAQKWGDLGFLLAVQGLPLIAMFGLATLVAVGYNSLPVLIALALNSILVMMRVALLWAIAPSYARTSAKGKWAFWLSPLADPAAVLRILLSSLRTPTQWRGRSYS
jgi:dolichol-phosphate mannosyltransferase